MALARVHTFVNGSTLSASQLNDEYDNILKQLNGTQTSAEIIIRAATANPALIVDQLTPGQPVQQWKVSGTEKCIITDTGQFESKLTTGTAPFVVASTTKVANLNADLLNGVAASGYLALNFAGTTVLSSGQAAPFAQIDAASGDAGVNLKTTGGTYRLTVSEAGQFVLQHSNSGWDAVAYTTGVAGSKVLRNADGEIYASEDYVDAKLTTLSFGAYYEASPTTSTKQSRFVVPQDVQNGDITRVQYVIGTAGSGSIVVKLERFNSAGVSQGSVSTTIGAATVAGQTYENDVADFEVAAGDSLVWTITTDTGTQADISIWAQGTQEVI